MAISVGSTSIGKIYLGSTQVSKAYLGSTQVFPQSIVLSGLVLYLDAGNTSSYPGSGTAWTDLSGNGNNGTLINGPTYDSGNGGSIVFDGSNDYVSLPNTLGTLFDNSSDNFTLSLFIKPTAKPPSNDSLKILFNVYNTGFGGGRVFILYRSPSGVDQVYYGLYIASSNRSDTYANITYSINEWMLITLVWNGTTSKIYKNATELTYSSRTSLSSAASTNSTPIVLAADTILVNPTYTGNFSNVLLYNRSLSSTEITQNFNAQKGRYGL